MSPPTWSAQELHNPHTTDTTHLSRKNPDPDTDADKSSPLLIDDKETDERVEP